MASNLEVKIYDYSNQNFNQEKPVQQPVKKQVTITPAKKTLTKLNIFLMASVFILLCVESVIYFHSVQTSISANKMQSDINKTREENDFLKVELANSKELTKIESVAINSLQMKPADSSKISYLQMPNQITDKQYLVTSILPKEKRVFVPIGY